MFKHHKRRQHTKKKVIMFAFAAHPQLLKEKVSTNNKVPNTGFTSIDHSLHIKILNTLSEFSIWP